MVLLCGACVDRININVSSGSAFPVVIDGYISDQPGPYRILVTKAFDIESKTSIKSPIQVKSVVISDNFGTTESLSAVSQGVYQSVQIGSAPSIRTRPPMTSMLAIAGLFFPTSR